MSTATLLRAHSKALPRSQAQRFAGPVESINTSGIRLLRAHARRTPGTFAIFPMSIHPVDTMLYLGAEGDTADEFERAFNLRRTRAFLDAYGELRDHMRSNPDFTLDIQNRAFIANGLVVRRAYLDAISRMGTEFEAVDFSNPSATADKFNRWAAEATKGLIQKVADASDFKPSTRLVAANATRFKGTWIERFDEELTAPFPFMLQNGDAPRVPTMCHKKRKLRLFEGGGYTGAEIPMLGGASTIVLLPEAGMPLNDFLLSLPDDAMQRVNAQLAQQTMDEVDLYLPKFRIETEVMDLVPAHVALGVRRVFNEGEAEMGALCAESLFVSLIKHKAVVEVTELGAEGAGVTYAAAESFCISETKAFAANRPFLAIFRDRSGAVIAFAVVHSPA